MLIQYHSPSYKIFLTMRSIKVSLLPGLLLKKLGLSKLYYWFNR
jgi:hypothetical protein